MVRKPIPCGGLQPRRRWPCFAREQSVDSVFTKYKQQTYSELVNHEFKGPLAVHPVFLKSPRRVEALVFLMMIALTAYFLLQRMYRKSVPAKATPKELRTTTQTLLRAFHNYTLIIHTTRLGREVQPTRLSTRQRQILQQLGFDTPAQILSRALPRAPYRHTVLGARPDAFSKPAGVRSSYMMGIPWYLTVSA